MGLLAIVTVMALQASPMEKATAEVAAYEDCVLRMAQEFEPVGEGASDTADAAVAACDVERGRLRYQVIQLFRENDPDWSAEEVEKFVREGYDKPLRAKALVAVFRIRAGTP